MIYLGDVQYVMGCRWRHRRAMIWRLGVFSGGLVVICGWQLCEAVSQARSSVLVRPWRVEHLLAYDDTAAASTVAVVRVLTRAITLLLITQYLSLSLHDTVHILNSFLPIIPLE